MKSKSSAASTESLRAAVGRLFAGFAGQGNVLTIPRPYLSICANNHIAALLLSQIIYWSDRTNDPDGWFAKSAAEWENELGISTYQCSRATKVLKPFGLQTKLKKSSFHEGAATLHYRIDRDEFSKRVLQFLENGLSTNSKTLGFRETAKRIHRSSETTAEQKIVAPATFENAVDTSAATDGLSNDNETPAVVVLLPADDPAFADEGVTEYPCTPADVNALIAAWWDWVMVRPVKRGQQIAAKEHFANRENRAYAENLIKRGVSPSDFAAFLGEIRFNPTSKYTYLREKEMTFCYVAPIVEQWVQADRAENSYSPKTPRITPKRPGVRISVNLDAPDALDQLLNHRDVYVDVPRPYISPQAVADDEAADSPIDFSIIKDIPL